MNARLIITIFLVLGCSNLGKASPNPFGSSKAECIQISKDKYEADMEYIQKELFNDSSMINATQDIHRIELHTCQNTLYYY